MEIVRRIAAVEIGTGLPTAAEAEIAPSGHRMAAIARRMAVGAEIDRSVRVTVIGRHVHHMEATGPRAGIGRPIAVAVAIGIGRPMATGLRGLPMAGIGPLVHLSAGTDRPDRRMVAGEIGRRVLRTVAIGLRVVIVRFDRVRPVTVREIGRFDRAFRNRADSGATSGLPG